MERKTTAAVIKKMTVLEMIEIIVELTNDEGIHLDGPAKPYIREMAKRLSLSPHEALMTAVIADMCSDQRIYYKDIARHFDVRPIKIISLGDVFDSLVKRGIIVRRRDRDAEVTYRMPCEVIEHLKNGTLPEPKKIDYLTAQEWFDVVDSLLNKRSCNEVSDEELCESLQELIEVNQQLFLCQRLHSFNLTPHDLVLLLALCNIFINDHDEHIMRQDIDEYFGRYMVRRHCNYLESGNHVLMTARLVEHACLDGQIDPNAWCITEYCKSDLLQELKLKANKEIRSNLSHHEDIAEKKLYYNERITKQVNELQGLLAKDRMKRVQQRLKDKGMRTGFTCIFYGAPGTGKTETVQQLARLTGRDIMLVDVPNIRSKWVGDTEKNIKGIFDRYRKCAEQSDNAPILLFNEADAILNKRNEGGVNAVDKMENAMQNIILQEMEKLDGIMIATTNLTSNLDDAFERRFLYKIEFDKPTPKERQHIWKAMLSDLTDEQALALAERYDFSGGQIENIARKRIISDILSDKDGIDMDALHEFCQSELLDKKNVKTNRIGF